MDAATTPAQQGADRDSTVHLVSYSLCRSGRHQQGKSTPSGSEPELAWDVEGLRVSHKAEESSSGVVVALEWRHVTGIWASVRSCRGQGFQFQVTLETAWHPEIAFLSATAPATMGRSTGDFLAFLQDSHAGRLKDGSPPRFASSRWASPIYCLGMSMRTLRLSLSRTGLVLDILFSVCFFAHLDRIWWSREKKLVDAAHALWQDLSQLQEKAQLELMTLGGGGIVRLVGMNLPYASFLLLWTLASHTSNWIMLVLLLQHLLALLVTLRSVWSTLNTVLRSLRSFLSAGQRVHKAVKKAKASKEAPSAGLGAARQ